MMTSHSQQQWQDLIQRHTGLIIREIDLPDCLRLIEERTQALHFADSRDYYRLLSQDSSQLTNAQEWQHLYTQLTTGETYFFRDRNQLQTISEHLLPRLLATKAKQSTVTPSLRVWSAGCSTGEEPYSLAILLKTQLPDLWQWQVHLLATDLSQAALDHARRGCYRNWSFRQTPSDFRAQYFHAQSNHTWELDASIRRQVTFRQHNLLADLIPNPVKNIHSFDLIICRNVFIYFSAATIATILAKFWDALVPGGYLITGHGELHGQNLGAFDILHFSESMVLQRPMAARTSSPPASSPPPVSAPAPLPSLDLPLPPSLPLCLDPQLEADHQTGAAVHYRYALVAFEQRNWNDAIARCQSALSIEATAVRPLYLWARVALEQQDIKQSKALLKKILVIDPSFIPAYVRMGDIYRLQQQPPRAHKMYKTAQALLQPLATETPVDYEASETAGELRQLLQHRIQIGAIP